MKTLFRSSFWSFARFDRENPLLLNYTLFFVFPHCASDDSDPEIDNSGEVTHDPTEVPILTQRTIVYPSFDESGSESSNDDFDFLGENQTRIVDPEVENSLSQHFTESASISKQTRPSSSKKLKKNDHTRSKSSVVHGAGHVTIQSAAQVINLTLPESMGAVEVAQLLREVMEK